MNNKVKSIIILFYLCVSLFIALFVMAVFFGGLGYWIGGGDDVISFFIGKLSSYFKVGLVGFLIGIPLWFFYYRNI